MKKEQFTFDANSNMTKIKQIRSRLGLTQKEMAERLAIDLQTYCRWDRGQYSPRDGAVRILKNLSILTTPLGLTFDKFPDDLL